MPVYGSNDGALVLPLNNCDFTDYRPLLQLGWYITKGEFLFEPGPWDEDIFWLCGDIAGRVAKRIETTKAAEKLSFPNGGVYLLRNTDSHALIRSTDFTSRPSHADQLHVDLWIHGRNIAVDAGTYLYSGGGHWRNGLAHTSVHNTVTVDNKDQMIMLSRFTWTNWSKGKVLKHEKDTWQGEHDGYKPVSHKRTVMSLEGDRWLVIDKLKANELHHYALHWLLNDFPFEQQENSVLLSLDEMKYKVQVGVIDGNGNFSIVRSDPKSTRGWRSRYYGHKEPAISVTLEADLPQVTFWSFFGFENDLLELEGNILKINSKNIPLAE
jgi:asparagine synthase (glutamine-hydrolysing)